MSQNESHPSLTSDGAPPALQRVSIGARLTAPLLDVQVEQHYANVAEEPLEIVYSFPVPPRAVLLGLSFTLGGRTLIGRVQAKRDAEKSYDSAVDDGHGAVLVEQQRDGLYTANLGNLAPGETACIRLRYGQFVEAQGADWRVGLPTVLAPFYGSAEGDAGLPHRAIPMQSLAAEYPLDCTLFVAGLQHAPSVRCTSHESTREAQAEGVLLRLAPDARLDRDVVFLVPRAGAAVLAGPDGERAVVAVSTTLEPGDVRAEPIAVRLVLDCSGSMAGDSMDWAAVACDQLVRSLTPADVFSVTRFGSRTDHWMRRLTAATERQRLLNSRRLLNVAADLGGTEMEFALREAAALGCDRERSEVVLVTDGEIWASDALVRWALGSGLRVFVIGVGAAPNTPFLQRLARETGGSCEFVTPGEDMLRAVERILLRMRAPRRETLAVDWPVKPDWTLQWPAVAHAGETVHLLAGFESVPLGRADVAGQAIDLTGHAAADDTLARVVAYQRLLSGQFSDAALAAERYQVVTEWTSLVAVHERADADRIDALPRLAQVRHMLAAGWGGTGRVAKIVDFYVASAAPCMPVESMDEMPASALVGAACLDSPMATAARPRRRRPEAVRAERREASIKRRSGELSGWIRAINRRILVESLSGVPQAPTLDWLRPCISARMSTLLEEALASAADERAVVTGFIAALGESSSHLDEALSGATQSWLDEAGSGTGDDAAFQAGRKALETFVEGRIAATGPTEAVEVQP
jgi:Ca-activated chloride channel family protein